MILKNNADNFKIYTPTQIFSWAHWFYQNIGIGAQLQDVISTDRDLVFELYNTQLFWLWVDLDSQNPFISIQLEKPVVLKKSKPVQLFLSAHAEGLRLTDVRWDKKVGRGLVLEFGYPETGWCEIKVTLLRGQPNVLVSNGEKSISWNKPRLLSELKFEPSEDLIHDFDGLAEGLKYKNYRSTKKNPNDIKLPAVDENKDQIKTGLKKKIEKLEKTLNLQNEKLDDSSLENIINLINRFQNSAGLDNEIESVIDFPKNLTSFGRRLDFLFQHIKSEKQKFESRRLKLVEIKNQIEKLQMQLVQLNSDSADSLNLINKNKKQIRSRLIAVDSKKFKNVQFRTFELSTGLKAYMGKSAVDNQNLIRQSQPWYVWLHLRDIPSAHVVIAAQKNQKISSSEIQEAAIWLLKEHTKNKDNKKWPSISVIVTECRYVTPVRGDSRGRVNYKNEKVFNFNSTDT